MRIAVTVKEFTHGVRLCGIRNYYSAISPYFRNRVVFCAIGRRSNETSRGQLLLRFFRDLIGLYQELKKNDVKILVVNPSLLWPCLIRDGVSVILGRLAGKKVIVFFRGWRHEIAERLGRKPNRWWFQLVFGGTDALIVLSEKFVPECRRMGFKTPIFVETTSVDIEDIVSSDVASLRTDKKVVKVLYLARVEVEKGIFEIIDAFAKVRAVLVGGVELVIAGDGTAIAKAQERVRELNLDGVEFCGYIEGNKKREALREADLYIFGSYFEGMPNSVLEAMTYGLPVITTAVGGLWDFFEDGKMGFLIEGPDPELISEKILALVNNPEIRSEMGRYNSCFAKEHFLAKTVARRLEGIWESICNDTAERGKTYHWKDWNYELFEGKEIGLSMDDERLKKI